jgi:hypothetical protein
VCCYRPALKLLTTKTNLSSLKLDFIPWLTRHCLKATAAAAAAGGSDGRALSLGGCGLHPSSLSPAELALARHGSGFLLSGATGSSSFTNIAAAATAAGAAGAEGSGSGAGAAAAAAAGSSGGAAAGSGSGQVAAVAESSTAGSMAGDIGEMGDGESWGADVGMGLPGVLTGLGLPGEGYMALSHAGGSPLCQPLTFMLNACNTIATTIIARCRSTHTHRLAEQTGQLCVTLAQSPRPAWASWRGCRCMLNSPGSSS